MKFLYMADTHIGGSDDAGYRQQPRFLKRLDLLAGLLREYLRDNPEIAFVAHGGDLVEETSAANIAAAVKIFSRMPRPLFLALGNHDMTAPGSDRTWLGLAPDFFPGGDVNFTVREGGATFDFFCCNWGPEPRFWDAAVPQIPWLEPEQVSRLGRKDDSSPVRIAVTHAPVFGLPPEQTGLDAPLHPPEGDFSDVVPDALDGTNVRLVLGAHTHMNMSVARRGARFVTASAFTETPFEFKVVEVSGEEIRMSTVALHGKTGLPLEYDFDKTFVQGRLCDRSFSDKIP